MVLAGKSIHLYRRLRLALHSLYVLVSITDSGGWCALAVILVCHAVENEFLDSSAISRILFLV